MNVADIKRQILMESDKTGIRKKIVDGDAGLRNEDVIEMGGAFEQLVTTKGWAYVEQYILHQANPTTVLFSADEETKARARGLILLMQHIDAVIRAKNEINARGNQDGASRVG